MAQEANVVMKHVVLLGDSIFDNAAYVDGGPAVLDQLRERLPAGWQATLLAVDGSTTSDVAGQLARLPKATSHLVISTGGNDALGHSGILEERARSVEEVLSRLASMREDFQRQYRRMLETVRAAARSTLLCTIYDPYFPDARLQRCAVAALAVFNDVVSREAVAAGIPLIDLRLVFSGSSDYANPIEPSVQGGAKLAATIARIVTSHDFSTSHTVVFGSGQKAVFGSAKKS